MSFFDFHLHPTLQCMFSEADSKTSPWIDIDVKKIPWFLRWCTEFEYILGSQADLRMLNESKADLLCVAVFVPERGMTTNSLILKQAQGTLSAYLNPKRLDKINNETLKPYPDLVNEDLDVLFNPARFGVTDKQIVALTKGVPFDPDDPSKTYVVFSVEGLHSLSPTMDKTKLDRVTILNNLDELRSKIPIISINITHLEQYRFVNHAYGIQFVADEDFRPTGNRISDDGLAIIRHCYENDIMIDIKHMSLATRRMLIEQVRTLQDFQNILQPLICTHAGFTGLSYKDIPDYLTTQKVSGKDYRYLLWGKPRIYGMLDFMTAFNPSSINLYDEDILAVIQSGGMIGISLDKRILGYSEADSRPAEINELTFEEEYISNAETDVFFTRKVVGKKMTEDFCITSQEVLQGGVVNPALGYYHLCHFMQHVLHFIKIASQTPDINKALTQICIGSDFDGIINPVWCCPSVSDFGAFKNEFIKNFMSFAHSNRDLVQLPAGFDVNKFADQLFFENGKNFIMRRLQLIHNS
jgi:microsomal dipeptidase-like Zn-dependent dipeptidase